MKYKPGKVSAKLTLPLLGAGILACLAVSMLLVPAAQAAVQAAEEARVQYTPEELEDSYQRLQTSIMSPYCQGLTLADCPTSGAVAMRARIHTWLEEGRSSEWIVNTLADEYGEWIRSAPKFSGFGLLAWLAPGAALILGGVWVGGFMRRNTKPQPDMPAQSTQADTAAQPRAASEEDVRLREIEKRVEAELDAWQA
jgi:cytochrome c-type biogenesis protein CcmH